MPYWAGELLNLSLRWLHVLAAIFWIGQTALFTWLDTRMRVERDESGEEVWMVHGGGYFRAERLPWQKPARHLHWFKWESALTWASGFLLFGWVYYHGGILVPVDGDLSPEMGFLAALGIFVVVWALYDLAWSRLWSKAPWPANVLGLVLLVGLAWVATQIFTGRAAFLVVGATLGTIMAANVWMRILPGMRRAVAAVEAGQDVPSEVKAQTVRAAHRSKHNTYLVFPVVFIMISNHYPVTTYGHAWNWVMLGVFTLVGFLARWLVDLRERKPA